MLNLKEGIMWAFLALAGLGLAYAKGHSDATDTQTLKHQEALLAAAHRLEVERETTQRALADVSKNWQAYLASSSVAADRVLADLRGRNVGLQVKLADASVRCVLGDGRPLADGSAELHPETSRFLIEQAQRADAQVMGLQETVRALQGGAK